MPGIPGVRVVSQFFAMYCWIHSLFPSNKGWVENVRCGTCFIPLHAALAPWENKKEISVRTWWKEQIKKIWWWPFCSTPLPQRYIGTIPLLRQCRCSKYFLGPLRIPSVPVVVVFVRPCQKFVLLRCHLFLPPLSHDTSPIPSSSSSASSFSSPLSHATSPTRGRWRGGHWTRWTWWTWWTEHGGHIQVMDLPSPIWSCWVIWVFITKDNI